MTKIYSFRTNKIFFQIRAKKETNWKPLPPSSPSFSCPTRPTSPSPFGRPEKPRNTIAITRKNVWSKMGMGEIINGLFTLATFVNKTIGDSNMHRLLCTQNDGLPLASQSLDLFQCVIPLQVFSTIVFLASLISSLLTVLNKVIVGHFDIAPFKQHPKAVTTNFEMTDTKNVQTW